MLPLPACIHDTAFGYEIISKEWMDNKWCSRPVHSHEPDHPQDAAALLVKIVGVWYVTGLLHYMSFFYLLDTYLNIYILGQKFNS